MVESLLAIAIKMAYVPVDIDKMTYKEATNLRYSFHHDVVNYEGKLYWIGGFSSVPQTWFHQFNGVAWTQLPNLPIARAGHTSIVAGNYLYVIGGLAPNGSDHSSLVSRYDFLTGAWTVVTSVPTTVAFGDGVNVGDYIYLFGGMTSNANSETPTKFIQYKYHIPTDKWTEITSTQYGRLDTAVAAYKTDIYLIGGRTGGTYTNKMFRFDTLTDTYHAAPDMPGAYGTRRCFHNFDDRLISMWGSTGSGGTTPYQGTNYYLPETETWKSLPNNANARGFGGSGILQDKIYYFSGIKGSAGQSDAFVLSV